MQRLGNPEHSPHIPTVEIRRQPELRRIGQFHRFLILPEPEQRRDRPKCLLPSRQHLRRHVHQHRWFVKRPAQRMTPPASQHLRALGYRIGNMPLHFRQRRLVNQRSLHHPRLQAIADLELRAHCFGQPGGKGVVNPVLHQKAIGANAGLAAVAILGNQRPRHRCVEIRVVKYDKRRIAAQFQRQPLERSGAALH